MIQSKNQLQKYYDQWRENCDPGKENFEPNQYYSKCFEIFELMAKNSCSNHFVARRFYISK